MPDLLSKLSYLLTPREKRNAVVLFILTSIGAAFEVVGVGAIPAFLGVISVPERILEFDAVRRVYDALGLTSTRQMILWSAFGLMGIFILKNAWVALVVYARSRYATNRQVHMSNRLFWAYLQAPYTFHLQRNTSELLRNTNSEANAISGGVILPLLLLAMESCVLVFILVLLVVVEPFVATVVFGVLGVVSFLYYRMTKAKIAHYSKEEQGYRKQSLQAVNQGLGGLKDARLMGRESFFFSSYQESTRFMAMTARYKAIISALPRVFLETVAVVGMLGATVILILQGRDLGAVVPTLALLGVSAIRLMPSFTRISDALTSLKWGTRSLTAVYDDLRLLEDQQRERVAAGLVDDGNALPFKSGIEINNLVYAYPGQEEPALQNVSLTIPRHASVAFVGPSGAGKSTIADVILGLLTPTSGQVCIDDIDVQTRLSSWQRKIGYIPQHIYLTDDSVRRNVAFGLHDHEISDDAVWAALRAAQLDDLIESLPEGLDTFVGERGVRMSGGQRQRIGIARALYHQPEVLVMDEATSALDNETERRIVEALEALQGDHTLIVIAHRLSTVRNCDTLFMLDAGRLVAEGSYDELMGESEAFRQMAGTPHGPDPLSEHHRSTEESRSESVPLPTQPKWD